MCHPNTMYIILYGNGDSAFIFVECMGRCRVLTLHEQEVRLYCFVLFEFEGDIGVRSSNYEAMISLSHAVQIHYNDDGDSALNV